MTDLILETHKTKAKAVVRQQEVGGNVRGPYDNVTALQYDGHGNALSTNQKWVLIYTDPPED